MSFIPNTVHIIFAWFYQIKYFWPQSELTFSKIKLRFVFTKNWSPLNYSTWKKFLLHNKNNPWYYVLHHIQDFAEGGAWPKTNICLSRSLYSIQHSMCCITVPRLKCVMDDIEKITNLALFEGNLHFFRAASKNRIAKSIHPPLVGQV